jgi:hypothetical protein
LGNVKAWSFVIVTRAMRFNSFATGFERLS